MVKKLLSKILSDTKKRPNTMKILGRITVVPPNLQKCRSFTYLVVFSRHPIHALLKLFTYRNRSKAFELDGKFEITTSIKYFLSSSPKAE